MCGIRWNVLDKSCDLLCLRDHKVARLSLQIEGGDAVYIASAEENGGKLSQALSSAHSAMHQVLQCPHYGHLAIVRTLVPFLVEVSIAHTQDGCGKLDLLLQPLTRVLHASSVMAMGRHTILSQPSHQVCEDELSCLLTDAGGVDDEDGVRGCWVDMRCGHGGQGSGCCC